jgi:hypothetical protein
MVESLQGTISRLQILLAIETETTERLEIMLAAAGQA